ncbi:MAG: hypothetical protein AAF960_10420 [Bacteroidota bacterium]
MGYSNFKNLRQVSQRFKLTVRQANLLTNIQPIVPSEWLKKTVELAYAVPLSNEKVKSERLISPVLTEVHQLFKDKLTLFSGEELNVKPEEGLNGACDFFFSAVPNAYLLEAPIVSLAEAKDEDMDYGIAQCTAQMLGAQIFNADAGQPMDVIWGCATTAGEWKFLKLVEKTLYIDVNSYYLNQLDQLLGAFNTIFKEL